MSARESLRIELFPSDLDRFVDFYLRVLRFELVVDRRGEPSPYVAVRRGDVRIGAVAARQPVDPAARSVPQGVEIVFEVVDLEAERNAVVGAGSELAEEIVERPWGQRDFRLFDPDGYYLRFTTH
jgi:predicted enzyme related to lactoylglutathione lyase